MQQFLQFLAYWGLATGGIIIIVLYGLVAFSASTKAVNNFITVKAWWRLNAFFTLASFVIITLLSILLTLPGGGWLITYLTAGQLDAGTPFSFYATATASGILVQFIIDKWRGIKNPVQLDLRDVSKKTDIPKEEIINNPPQP